ncbi:hypothetical protein CQY20_18150 [Mycolicibacterium agri]|uniref:Uncharacterized protein n=1 Tax=Mycolicibacterium agri TaxID=36811 RepID=A0A2A7MZE4_MYCAG|nr:hypothetical protein [Mycolicibacterium agri]PEG36681.1 hypothetical protein CQY20_18150 [Mycolicibacterium agri]GFG49140.1 hypothetical protein MAGR_05810 [Mycolicibacterium agri]
MSIRTTARRSVGLFLLAGAASGVIAMANAATASAEENSLYMPSVPSRNADIVMLNPQPLPPGPDRVMLNPQPLPPGPDRVMLNPQPLPPGPDRVMLNPQPLPPHPDWTRRVILSRLAF